MTILRERERERERETEKEKEIIQRADLNLCIKTVWKMDRNIIVLKRVIKHIHLWQFYTWKQKNVLFALTFS